MTLGADFQESNCLESLSIPFFGVFNALEAFKMGILGPDNPEMGARRGQNDDSGERQFEIMANPGGEGRGHLAPTSA